jgi:hypothetical protein
VGGNSVRDLCQQLYRKHAKAVVDASFEESGHSVFASGAAEGRTSAVAALGTVAVHFFSALASTVFRSTSKSAINLDFAPPNADRPFVPVLVDLLMYHSPEVFEKAFDLLGRHHSQQRALYTSIMKTQLIVRDARKRTLKLLQAQQELLGPLFESFSVWAMGNWPDRTEQQQAKERLDSERLVVDGMRLLIRECYGSGGGVVVGGVTGAAAAAAAPLRWAQDMLRGLGMHHVVVRALRIPKRRTDDLKDDEAGRRRKARVVEHNKIRLRIHMHCYEFMRVFAAGHEVNQQLLHSLIVPSILLHELSVGAAALADGAIEADAVAALCSAMDTLTAVFVGNSELLDGIQPAVWAKYGALAGLSRASEACVVRFYTR